MYCRKCGNNLADDDAFCSKCGAKVIKDSPPAEETSTVARLAFQNRDDS